jgi:hypothetical protein
VTKKEILSHARTDLTRMHHIIEQHKKHHMTMADSSPSANGYPVADVIKTHILFAVNFPSATVQSLDTPRYFFGPFLTQNGHTPPRVAMTPHICNQQQFAVSSCIFYCFFLSKIIHCLLNPSPFILWNTHHLLQ